MKTLEEYILEAEQSDSVFAVVDQDGCIMNVFNNEEDANKSKDELEVKGIKFDVKKMRRSEIENN